MTIAPDELADVLDSLTPAVVSKLTPAQAMKKAKIIARLLRKKLQDTGKVFTHGDYCDKLTSKLDKLKRLAYEGFVLHIADAIDKEQHEATSQEDLFDLEGEAHLGENRRIKRSRMHVDHAKEELALIDDNFTKVLAARDRKHDIFDKLEPYWPVGRERWEAVEEYKKEHPDEDE